MSVDDISSFLFFFFCGRSGAPVRVCVCVGGGGGGLTFHAKRLQRGQSAWNVLE